MFGELFSSVNNHNNWKYLQTRIHDQIPMLKIARTPLRLKFYCCQKLSEFGLRGSIFANMFLIVFPLENPKIARMQNRNTTPKIPLLRMQNQNTKPKIPYHGNANHQPISFGSPCSILLHNNKCGGLCLVHFKKYFGVFISRVYLATVN